MWKLRPFTVLYLFTHHFKTETLGGTFSVLRQNHRSATLSSDTKNKTEITPPPPPHTEMHTNKVRVVLNIFHTRVNNEILIGT